MKSEKADEYEKLRGLLINLACKIIYCDDIISVKEMEELKEEAKIALAFAENNSGTSRPGI